MSQEASDLTPRKENAEQMGLLIRKARESRGWTQSYVAHSLGTTQQTVDRIERGETIRSAYIKDILSLLSIPATTLDSVGRALAEPRWKPERLPNKDRHHVDETWSSSIGPAGILPFHRDADVGPNIKVFPILSLNGSLPILGIPEMSTVARPEPLFGVRDAYAVLIFDNDMVPAFRPGETAFINPHIRPRSDNDVLLIGPNTDDLFQDGINRNLLNGRVRSLLGETDDSWIVRTWTPSVEENLSKAEWASAHTIVGKFSRV